jgi:hypothetical protein
MKRVASVLLLLALGAARLKAEERERARLDAVGAAALRGAARAAAAEALARVEKLLPSHALPVRGEREGDRAVVRVQEHQQRVARDAAAALVHLVDGVARQTDG